MSENSAANPPPSLTMSQEVAEKPMNLLQYMLVPFGLTLRHKSIDYYFTGIFITFFGLFFLSLLLSFLWPTHSVGFILRILVFFYILTFVSAYLHLKKTFWKFIAMYDEISHFEAKHSIETRFTLPLVLFILCLVLSFIASALYFASTHHIYSQVFSPSSTSFKYLQDPISALLFIYWTFGLQFLNLELCYKYNKLICLYNRLVRRTMLSRSSGSQLKHHIDLILDKFAVNDLDFRMTVAHLNKIVLAKIILMSLMSISHLTINIINDIDYKLNFYPCFMLLMYNLYFILTQAIMYRKSRYQAGLITKLIVWKSTNLSEIVVE